MSTRDRAVRLGFQVGSGEPVDIPIRHMCVTGQTQEAGKTTTLEALIARAKVRAVTFITKRGEGAFAGGRRLAPYFRQRRADWQYVASLIDVTLGEKNKLLRSFLMKTCRDTQTLADVLVNVRAAKASARGFPESIYTEIEGYLELVVPQLAQLPPAHALTIGAGLNVMDVSPYRAELQALVIRSVLEHVYEDEHDVVVVIPEAWEFLPEGRGSPVKHAAETLIRKGAGLRNFMWLDSQDLAGVWKTAVRACPVLLIGVQREANEIKRTLANIHGGIAKPKAADVAGLELGEFVACWGKHAITTYVQPAGMTDAEARGRATGARARTVWRPARPAPMWDDEPKPAATPACTGEFESVGAISKRVTTTPAAHGFTPGGLAASAAAASVDRGSPVTVGDVAAFVDRGRRAQAVAEHLAYHGPGLTFGELAIGDTFDWAAPIPLGPEPMVKTSDVDYRLSRGTGKAQDYYRVERWGTRAKEAEEMNPQQEKKLDDLMKVVGQTALSVSELVTTLKRATPPVRLPDGAGVGELERAMAARTQKVDIVVEAEIIDAVIARLRAMATAEDPALAPILEVLVQHPEIRVTRARHTIEVDDDTLRGRLALLIHDGFMDTKIEAGKVFGELGRRGFKTAHPNVVKELDELTRMGFLTKSNKWYTTVGAMKRNIVEA